MTPFQQYQRLIGALRVVARDKGYALAVHGSLARDIDLIAVPWTEQAVDPAILAEAIRIKAEEITLYARLPDMEAQQDYFRAGEPGAKPWGRRVWSFMLGGGSYLDLSVMPLSPNDPVIFEVEQYSIVVAGPHPSKIETSEIKQ